MEPLIDLPDPAKARIKAAEAKAAQQDSFVRQAFERDVANAYQMSGGYFDLHQEELQATIDEARAGIEESSLIRAQLVFNAHAIEYRDFLRSPRELQPLLVRARDSLIREFGSHVRLAIETQESQQMAKAWDDFSRSNLASKAIDMFTGFDESQPLGDNPFPEEHPAHDVFEEATWQAKEDINHTRSELFDKLKKEECYDRIQSILTFRVHEFSACAKGALNCVGDEETAGWYDQWVQHLSDLYLQDTLQKGQLPDPEAPPGSPPLFTPELLPRITKDLTLELMRTVALYKKQCAARMRLLVERRQDVRQASEKLEKDEAAGTAQAKATASKRRGRPPDQERRDSIRSAISKYGEGWREKLSEIFVELDKQNVALRDFQGKKIDLGDGQTTRVSKWEDLDFAAGEQRKQIVDMLRKYAD